ncbi:MAG TPA: shikimate kinase [Candidatus Acidoferrales bacterium]|nr:shikimate kinase [Candidatus Acidoferrales bacterium]
MARTWKVSRLQAPMHKLSLIGMSGSGKTFWSNKLETIGYRLVSCDDRIEQKLSPELASYGHRGTGVVAAWMGWPDSARYREREQKYLNSEIAVMREILDELGGCPEEKVVVDTTGSVIYTGEEVCRKLRHRTTVVYLEASREEQQTLIQRYLEDPKPVLWSEHFQLHEGETPREAVARCYPQLIEHRRTMYENLAHRVVPISELRAGHLGGDGFLHILHQKAHRAR